MPLVIPLGENGDQAVVGAQSEPPQITSIGAFRNRQELCIPGHVFRLVLKPTGTSDGVET